MPILNLRLGRSPIGGEPASPAQGQPGHCMHHCCLGRLEASKLTAMHAMLNVGTGCLVAA